MAEQNDMKSDALTPLEVAQTLRIAKNTVYELVKRGELHAYRVGKKLRFDSRDVQTYINRGRNQADQGERSIPERHAATETPSVGALLPQNARPFILCGQDILLDILASHLEATIPGLSTYRSFLGSYNGLHELYLGNVHLASSHLWDAATDTYTLPFLPHLLPGVPLTAVRLVTRQVGFYVRKGNPKGIREWEDLARTDVQFVNREAGSGIRVLVDGKLRVLGLSGAAVSGYGRICTNHLVAATTVARGGGDCAVGSEMASRQVAGVDFVPLQDECYDLVFPTANEGLDHFAELVNRVCSAEFRHELEGLGGYGTAETGAIFRV